MLFGNVERFAIESQVTRYCPNRGFMALGYFNLHVAGSRFGVRAPDATMLACSLDEVGRRLERRGRHAAPELASCSKEPIIGSFLKSLYAPALSLPEIEGINASEAGRIFHQGNLIFAPDGDEAFDDGGHALQWDEGSSVRLIAFVNHAEELMTLSSSVEMRMDSHEFYGILSEWHRSFRVAWNGFRQMHWRGWTMVKTRLNLIFSNEGPWIFMGYPEADHYKYISSYYYANESSENCVRVVRGSKMRNCPGLFDEMSAAMQFPLSFGENWHALEEYLEYMDEWLPADGYVLVVENAGLVLSEEPPDQLRAFLTTINIVGEWWSKSIENDGRFNRGAKPFHCLMLYAENTDAIMAKAKALARDAGVPIRTELR